MTNKTMLWILAAVLVYVLVLWSKRAAAATTLKAAAGTSRLGTAPPASAAQGPTQPSYVPFGLDGGQTFTTQPNDAVGAAVNADLATLGLP
jgi:hypothetical protein